MRGLMSLDMITALAIRIKTITQLLVLGCLHWDSGVPMSIIKYGSNHPSIILQCDLKSAASVAAAGGVTTRSPIYSDAGIDVNGGSIAFTNYPGNAALQYAFQISIDVP